MTLIVQLAGGESQARAALKNAAEQDDQKVKRLRELAAKLPKVN